jgi:hypothetical protein
VDFSPLFFPSLDCFARFFYRVFGRFVTRGVQKRDKQKPRKVFRSRQKSSYLLTSRFPFFTAPLGRQSPVYPGTWVRGDQKKRGKNDFKKTSRGETNDRRCSIIFYFVAFLSASRQREIKNSRKTFFKTIEGKSNLFRFPAAIFPLGFFLGVWGLSRGLKYI